MRFTQRLSYMRLTLTQPQGPRIIYGALLADWRSDKERQAVERACAVFDRIGPGPYLEATHTGRQRWRILFRFNGSTARAILASASTGRIPCLPLANEASPVGLFDGRVPQARR